MTINIILSLISWWVLWGWIKILSKLPERFWKLKSISLSTLDTTKLLLHEFFWWFNFKKLNIRWLVWFKLEARKSLWIETIYHSGNIWLVLILDTNKVNKILNNLPELKKLVKIKSIWWKTAIEIAKEKKRK